MRSVVRVHLGPPPPYLVCYLACLSWGISSVGRALLLQSRCQRFEPAILHCLSFARFLQFGFCRRSIKVCCKQGLTSSQDLRQHSCREENADQPSLIGSGADRKTCSSDQLSFDNCIKKCKWVTTLQFHRCCRFARSGSKDEDLSILSDQATKGAW